jgi:hypothetical protein
MTEGRGTQAERIADLERWRDGEHGDEGAAEKLRRVRTDVDGLMGWRKWVLGATSAAALVVGALLAQLKDMWPHK